MAALLVATPTARGAATSTEQTKITAADAGAFDQFGYSLAIDGGTAVIGAPFDDDGGGNQGSAYVFVRNDSTWTQQTKLTAADADGGDVFGEAVSISGDTVVVGDRNDEDGGSSAGSAYVFVRNGSTWTQQTKLTASDASAGDQFGNAVAISGDTTLVGARDTDDDGTQSGSVYVFTRSGTAWTQAQILHAPGAAAGDQFGESVAIDDDTAVVGLPNDDDGGSDSGSAFVFFHTGTSWAAQFKLRADDAAAGDDFGWSVAVSGDTAVVGAPDTDDQGSNAGSAYVFTRSGTTWTEQTELTASNGEAGDQLGHAVAISGDDVALGAHLDDDGGENAGAAYVFHRTGVTWSQHEKLTASDAAANDQHGYSVGISDTTKIVGAIVNDDGGVENTGAAYVYAPETCRGLVPTHLGTDAAETITGTTGDDVIVALGGNDTIVGGGGNDTVCAGDGDDAITTSAGDDRIFGEAGADDIRSFGGNDHIEGGGGNDTIRSGAGNDSVWGDDGDDTIILSDGADQASGGTGSDSINGGAGTDTITGNGGNDILRGQGNNDTFWAGPGNDTIRGHAGNDTLNGNSGDDTLLAASGNDILNGGNDNDTLWAGTGADHLDGGDHTDFCHGGTDADPDTHTACETLRKLP